MDPAERNRKQRDELLATEVEILKTDRDFYMECMNDKLLSERETEVEVRDGLILYWNVYRRLRDGPES